MKYLSDFHWHETKKISIISIFEFIIFAIVAWIYCGIKLFNCDIGDTIFTCVVIGFPFMIFFSYLIYHIIRVGGIFSLSYYLIRFFKFKKSKIIGIPIEELKKLSGYDRGDPRRLEIEARIIYNRELLKLQSLYSSVVEDEIAIEKLISVSNVNNSPQKVKDYFNDIYSEMKTQKNALAEISHNLTQSYKTSVKPFGEKAEILKAIDSLIMGENIKNRLIDNRIVIENLKYSSDEACVLLAGISKELAYIADARLQITTFSNDLKDTQSELIALKA